MSTKQKDNFWSKGLFLCTSPFLLFFCFLFLSLLFSFSFLPFSFPAFSAVGFQSHTLHPNRDTLNVFSVLVHVASTCCQHPAQSPPVRAGREYKTICNTCPEYKTENQRHKGASSMLTGCRKEQPTIFLAEREKSTFF